MGPPPVLAWSERGAGAPLLLIHGVMITGEMFAPVLDRLAARHRVIVPDLRGHGRSRHLPPPYSAARLAQDVVELLDHLGVGVTDVVGYSQGGAIAQQLVLDHPGRCRRLVLACTYAYNMATLRERVEGRVAPLLIRALGMRRFARLVIAQGLTRVDRSRADWVADLIGSQDAARMVAAWRASMAFDSRRRLGEIRCPTLVLAGGSDTAVPMHHARQLHEGIPGSRLVVLEDGDHALIWAMPDAFAGAVAPFVNEG
jgi:pimeloyl-ACP methyl ester carboxylesterase